MTAFGLIALGLMVVRPEPVQGPAGSLALGLAGGGIWLTWYGLLEIPRQIRALKSPSVLRSLRPVYALRRERGTFLFRREVEHAWLVLHDPVCGHLAIPMELRDAQRCAPDTRAAVHGDLRVGGRVALRFGAEVMWPTGRVEPVPEDAVGPDERYRRPAKKA